MLNLDSSHFHPYTLWETVGILLQEAEIFASVPGILSRVCRIDETGKAICTRLT